MVLLARKINSNLSHSLPRKKELSVSAWWQIICQSASWPGFWISVSTRSHVWPENQDLQILLASNWLLGQDTYVTQNPRSGHYSKLFIQHRCSVEWENDFNIAESEQLQPSAAGRWQISFPLFISLTSFCVTLSSLILSVWCRFSFTSRIWLFFPDPDF